jgi:hypothetical protein
MEELYYKWKILTLSLSVNCQQEYIFCRMTQVSGQKLWYRSNIKLVNPYSFPKIIIEGTIKNPNFPYF